MIPVNERNERHAQAEEIINRAIQAIGDLEGAKLDLLCDNMEGTTSELRVILIAIGHRCGFCDKDIDDPIVGCKRQHYITFLRRLDINKSTERL